MIYFLYTLVYLYIVCVDNLKYGARNCKCEYDIQYLEKIVVPPPCELPETYSFRDTGNVKILLIVRSCKGKATMQFYDSNRIILDKEFKNARRLSVAKTKYSDLDGLVSIDSIYTYYAPEEK